jgi:hypothetical protein
LSNARSYIDVNRKIKEDFILEIAYEEMEFEI